MARYFLMIKEKISQILAAIKLIQQSNREQIIIIAKRLDKIQNGAITN